MSQMLNGELLTGGWLEERMVRCGRKGCRCAKGRLHGPYVYLTDRIWDEQAERWRVRRRYVRTADVAKVRRVLCAAKAVHRDIQPGAVVCGAEGAATTSGLPHRGCYGPEGLRKPRHPAGSLNDEYRHS